MKHLILLTCLFSPLSAQPRTERALDQAQRPLPRLQIMTQAYEMFEQDLKEGMPVRQAIRNVSVQIKTSEEETKMILAVARSIDITKKGAVRDLALGLGQKEKEENPHDPKAFFGSAHDLYRIGRYRDSYDDYNEAYRLGDQSDSVVLGISAAALKLGDYETAVQAAKLVLAREPKNQEALFLYHASVDRVPAVHLPRAFGELRSNNFESPSSQLSAINAAGTTKSQRPLETPASPARSKDLTTQAAMALREKDYATAYLLADEAIIANRDNVQALNYRAMANALMHHYVQAEQDASIALGLAPGNVASLHTRSWVKSKQKKYREGLADAEEAIKAQPNNAYLYQDSAFALSGLGDREGALEALRRSAEIDSKFTPRLERALQLPEDSDMTFLFDDPSPVQEVQAKTSTRPRRFLQLVLITALGGLLIAAGTLHIMSGVKKTEGPKASFWTKYRQIRQIGTGGMGVVYEAYDQSLERRVAVKKMRDEIRLDPEERSRFVTEARMVAQLHHPNIADIYGIVEEGSDVYLVFELVPGRSLEALLSQEGHLPFDRARQIIGEMSLAITHAHQRGIIHRDLKPSNVIITPDGRVKVMDFGVARQAKDAVTKRQMTNHIEGTPPYMSPEQEQGRVCKQSDVYSLAVCFYEMLTGQLPFAGQGAVMMLNKMNGKMLPVSRRVLGLPAGLDLILASALDPNPDKRTPTPAQFIEVLSSLKN